MYTLSKKKKKCEQELDDLTTLVNKLNDLMAELLIKLMFLILFCIFSVGEREGKGKFWRKKKPEC